MFNKISQDKVFEIIEIIEAKYPEFFRLVSILYSKSGTVFLGMADGGWQIAHTTNGGGS